MTPLACVGGKLVPQSEAVLALNDAGFVMGATVTDLCRTFGHRPFRLGDHLRRFRAGCQALGITLRLDDGQLTALAEELIAHNARLIEASQDLALVFLATPGPVGYYLGQPGGAGDGEPTQIIHTFPLPFERYRHLFEFGGRLIVPRGRHIPTACVDPRLKQRSRLHWYLADQEARRREPGSQALLLDLAGNVTETSSANVLIVRQGAIISPPPEAILGGISLQVTRELCATLGVAIEERAVRLEECLQADEILLASTPYGIAGVSRLQGQLIPWPGPMLRRLRAAWDDLVGMDIAGQMRG